jgi:hypothetical protein
MTATRVEMPAPLARRRRSLPLAAARAAGALVVVLGAVGAGIGWLYLLRDVGALHAGPAVPEALPLQRLAGNDAQPLARLLVAWLPTGALAGLALRAIGLERRTARAALMLPACLILLAALGATADAVTANDPLRAHVSEQAHRPATWLAACLVALAVALPGRRR